MMTNKILNQDEERYGNSGGGYQFFKSTYANIKSQVIHHLGYKDKLLESWAKCAEHRYTEFHRVEAGAEAWRNGDSEEVGNLSFESDIPPYIAGRQALPNS